MVDIKVGQTIRVYASVWNFCGTSPSIYIHDVQINAMPSTLPASCQDISGIGISFDFVTSGSSSNCHSCTPTTTYSHWGSANTDSNGVAYLDYTVTDSDYNAFKTAQNAGTYVRVIACITGSKGQTVLQNNCSDAITVLPSTTISPTYAIELHVYENTFGLLDLLRTHAPLVTQGINSLLPSGTGWVVDHTIIDSSNGIITLYMSEVASWNIIDVAISIMGIAALVASVVLIALYGLSSLAIGLGVAGFVVVTYKLFDLINQVSVLTQQVANFQTKDQNDTKLDQMVGNVENNYNNSPKTDTDCQNKLNGLKISYDTYFDTMQKDFPNLYTISMKRAFDTAADSAISDFKAGTKSCDIASESIITAGGLGKSDVSTNFTTVYNANNPYVSPPKEECWIPGPLGDCVLTANTGKWIVGTILLAAIAGGVYYYATRYPKETRRHIERVKKGVRAVKAEAQRARKAYYEIKGPVKVKG